MEHTMRKILALAAVLSAVALAAPAASAAGMSSNGKFCLNGPGTAKNCSYQTMAACEKAKKGTQTCAANTASTTGAGSMGSQSQTAPVGGGSSSMKK